MQLGECAREVAMGSDKPGWDEWCSEATGMVGPMPDSQSLLGLSVKPRGYRSSQPCPSPGSGRGGKRGLAHREEDGEGCWLCQAPGSWGP